MTQINWGLITNGAEFQSLCGTLLGFEYPEIEQFSAPGKDLGVDAYHPTRFEIYQFKFHTDTKKSIVISDAKKEFSRISQRIRDNSRYWKNIKKWILITNQYKNPQLKQRWTKEIIPKFITLNLTAELITLEDLEQLLIKHSSVREAYFEKKNRIFITLNEAILKLKSESINERSIDCKLFGREKDLKIFHEFISNDSKNLFLIYGEGGIGKTRYLLQCAIKAAKLNRNVYWANTETLENSNNWFHGITYNKNIILFIDEPTDIKTMNILFEQINSKGTELNSIKIVISTRYQNSQIIKLISSKKNERIILKHELKKLTEDFIKNIVNELIPNNFRTEKVINRIARKSNSLPIWAIIYIQLLNDENSTIRISDDPFNIAEKYLDQGISSIQNYDKKHINNLIKWLCIFGEMNVENNYILEFIKNEEKNLDIHDIKNIFNELEKIKIIYKNGRIFHLKPELIRNYILSKTFISNEKPSPFFEYIENKIIANDNELPEIKKIIESLNRIELIQKFKNSQVNLLGNFIDKISRKINKNEFNVLQLTKYFSQSRPNEVVDICKSIRNKYYSSRVDDKIILKSIIFDLPSIILEASRYAFDNSLRNSIINELFEISKIERDYSNSDSIQPNDGKRSHQVIEKIIFNGEDFLTRYDNESKNIALKKLNYLEIGKNFSNSDLFALKAITIPLISLEREEHYYDRGNFIFKRYLINPKHNIFKIRNEIIRKIWDLAINIKNESILKTLLYILKKNHFNLARIIDNPEFNFYKDELNYDILKITDLLKDEKLPDSILKILREFWEWHLKYGSDEKNIKLARECENIFLSKPNYEFFDKFFSSIYSRDNIPKIEEISSFINKFINDSSGESLADVIVSAVSFSGDSFYYRSDFLILELEEKHFDKECVQNFCWKYMLNEKDYLKMFSSRIIRSRINRLRKSNSIKEQENLLSRIKDFILDNKNYNLIEEIYLNPNSKELNLIDFNFIKTFYNELDKNIESKKYVRIVINFYHLDPSFTKDLINDYLQISDISNKITIIDTVIDFFIFSISDIYEKKNKRELGKWIFNLLLELPDIQNIINTEWKLSEISRICKFKFSIFEFNEFLNNRIKHSEEYTKKNQLFTIIPYKFSFNFFEFVEHITDSSSEQDIKIVKDLLSSYSNTYKLRTFIPQCLEGLDPLGIIVPDLVVEKLRENFSNYSGNIDDLFSWSIFANKYDENSEAWKKIAVVVLEIADDISNKKEKYSIINSITNTRIETWSTNYGEFPSIWKEKVNEFEVKYNNESNIYLKNYYKHRLDCAKYVLNREYELFEEEKIND